MNVGEMSLMLYVGVLMVCVECVRCDGIGSVGDAIIILSVLIFGITTVL